MNFFLSTIFSALLIILPLSTHAGTGTELNDTNTDELLYEHINHVEEEGYLETIRQYLKENPEVINQPTEYKTHGWVTPLSYAIKQIPDIPLLQMQVKGIGADANPILPDGTYGWVTPLNYAMKKKPNISLIQMLVEEFGANANQILPDGTTPFVEAVFGENRCLEVVELLQKNGAFAANTPVFTLDELEGYLTAKLPQNKKEKLDKKIEASQKDNQDTLRKETKKIKKQYQARLQEEIKEVEKRYQKQFGKKRKEMKEKLLNQLRKEKNDTENKSLYPSEISHSDKVQSDVQEMTEIYHDHFKEENEKAEQYKLKQQEEIDALQKQFARKSQQKKLGLLEKKFKDLKKDENGGTKQADYITLSEGDFNTWIQKETMNQWLQITKTDFMQKLLQQQEENAISIAEMKKYVTMSFSMGDMLDLKSKIDNVGEEVKTFIAAAKKELPWINTYYALEEYEEILTRDEVDVSSKILEEDTFKETVVKDFLEQHPKIINYLESVCNITAPSVAPDDLPDEVQIIAYALVWIGGNIGSNHPVALWKKKRVIFEQKPMTFFHIKEKTRLHLNQLLTNLVDKVKREFPESTEAFLNLVRRTYEARVTLLNDIMSNNIESKAD